MNNKPVFKETIKVKYKQKKYIRVETLHSLSCSVIEIAQDSQVNMSLKMLKILKFIIFNLSTKNIKTFMERFFQRLIFFHRSLFLRSTVFSLESRSIKTKIIYNTVLIEIWLELFWFCELNNLNCLCAEVCTQ